ncbi:hypothetical protein [Rhizobium sp. BE258]|uniref:hypothetical protein n=1 Tax=Rhizobium sp. BE258 TaxID=2817722 RepID=UPI00286044B3|nr:hypothetical protein [Rhizobium sp. BE258]MDR7148023.1 hypothetical protein [Rhizobium sp. BE258]
MTDDVDDIAVLAILRNVAESRRKTARSMLDAYAADALPEKATPNDISFLGSGARRR